VPDGTHEYGHSGSRNRKWRVESEKKYRGNFRCAVETGSRRPTFPTNGVVRTSAENAELSAEYERFTQEIIDSGEFVSGARLAGPDTVSTVRVRSGSAEVTDGPFVESKEHLGGYYLVDVPGPERAAELAARIPDARFTGAEIRPLLDAGGQEM
jgi:hypothetical protein